MLRRTQRIVLRQEEDDELEASAFVPEPAIATGPVPDRRNLEQWLGEVERAAAQQKTGPSGIEALRAEVQRALVTNDNDTVGAQSVWRAMLKPSRLALLAVALIAGIVAAYFAMQGGTPAPAPAPVVEVAAEPVPPPLPQFEILVAKQVIALGDRLTAENVEWKPWPGDAMRDDYISKADKPEAVTQMAHSIARFEFFPGEPIRAAKLATPGDGYVSAVLAPGERAVSIRVVADTAAGGFIQPNDHVDVLLSQSVGDGQAVETLLSNVRVLAIAHRLGDVGTKPEGDDGEEAAADSEDGKSSAPFAGEVIATLVLDAAQAEVITAARGTGSLSLVLRSISDFAAAPASSSEATANQRIRLTSPFWLSGSNGASE